MTSLPAPWGDVSLPSAPLADTFSRIASLQNEIRELTASRDDKKAKLNAYDAAIAWMQSDDCRLEPNDCTRLHRLSDAVAAGEVLNGTTRTAEQANRDGVLTKAMGVFIVRHDWYAAIGAATDEVGDEFVLPYEHCAFEFRMGGATVICIALQPEGEPRTAIDFVEVGGRWFCFEPDEANEAPRTQAIWNQVRAVCVAMDAEVATHDVVRAPIKLNEKRERKGLSRIPDHRVIDLARRHRTAPVGIGETPKSRKRLHFRRGHWRHYEDHKTWIKWMLVGNPDLGFIDHHYAL